MIGVVQLPRVGGLAVWLQRWALFFGGAAAASLLLGGGLSLVGELHLAAIPGTWAIAALTLLLLAAMDFGIVRPHHPPSFARQTNPIWWRRYGWRRAMAMWGFDLGLGITTIRTTSMFWGAALLAGLGGPGAAAIYPMMAYACGLTAGVAGAALLLSSVDTEGRVVDGGERVSQLADATQRLGGGVLTIVAAAIAIAIFGRVYLA
jgi:hypothetical protein